MNLLMNARRSEFCLAKVIQEMLTLRLPLPVEDLSVDMVSSIASLQFDKATAVLLETRDEVEQFKKGSDRLVKCVGEIVCQTSSAAPS